MTVWVCAACGRVKKDRNDLRDVACYINAVECEDEQKDGKWIAIDKPAPMEPEQPGTVGESGTPVGS